MSQTKIIKITELQKYTKKDWENIVFQNVKSQTKDVKSQTIAFEDLLEILKGTQKEYDQIIQINPADEKNQESFSINFVGILIINGSKQVNDKASTSLVIICYPKYFLFPFENKNDNYELPNSNKRIRTIIKVIEKCKELNQDIEAFKDDSDDELLSLMIWLIHDYIQNGLYSKELKTTEQNGVDEIVWHETLEKEQAFLNRNKKPLFLNFWTKNKSYDTKNLTRKIHLAALSEIMEFLIKHGLYSIFTPNLQLSTNLSLKNIGNHKMLTKTINNSMKSEFNSRRRFTLKKLLAYIEKSQSSKNHMSQKYGTRSFNLVFEHVCKKVFADDEKLHEIIKEHSPKWEVPKNPKTQATDEVSEIDGFITKEKPRLIPDIVTTHEKTGIVIIDAKYYNPNWQEISAVPGAPDIAKQHLYQLAFEEYASENNIFNRVNFFIMSMQQTYLIQCQFCGRCLSDKGKPLPNQANDDSHNCENRGFVYKGKVGLEFLQDVKDPKLSDILVFEISAEIAYEHYLHGGYMLDNLISIALSQRLITCGS